jgi:two-component system CheB/CheR fusion protein
MAKKNNSKTKDAPRAKKTTSKKPQRGDKSYDGDGEKQGQADPNRSGDEVSDFPIVGIGASAGGLTPIKEFLDALPDNPGVAIVVVQHLDPTRKSLAPELLASHTSMKLCEVVDNPRVLPNSVYVIPPGKYLSISRGELVLTEPDQPRGTRMAIDYFLRSLAVDIHQRSVGILMSGGGTDGTLGIKLIKEVGGMVMVQDPETCDHDSMPRSAIDTGVVDFILPPKKMADVLVRYANHSYVRQAAPELEPEEGRADIKGDLPESEVFASILALLRVRSKHDFRNYKVQTLLRRTRRRMCLAHLDDFGQYLEYLREHTEEIDALVKDLLISVTNFFRDDEAWEELRKQVIVPIVEKSKPDEPIRIWVPGCATGEEPYSLAMLMLEELHRAKKVVPIQVFASDIDKDALGFARHGIYPSSIQADVSPERLSRYFKVNGNDQYQVSKQVRELVVFAEQNLIADPPFSKLDLICCRNLLIYLKPDVQEKVISLFHFALRNGGFLFLGTAETVGRQTDLFQPVSKRWRIFHRLGPTRPERVEIPVTAGAPRREVGIREQKGPELREARLARLANQWMVEWLAPAAILVDDKWNILYINGNVDRYVQHSQGVPSDDLLAKVRPGLRVKLRSAVHQAFEDDRVISLDAFVAINKESHPVRILVRPLRDTNDRRLALVVFDDDHSPAPGSPSEASTFARPVAKSRDKSPAAASKSSRRQQADLDEHRVIQQLEHELTSTKEDLQGTLEQFEASNEEFKAANEEVMSINEELQSTNEELETSKEELQSLNEELTTVNSQLASKVDELETQHADLRNLVNATDMATICVDRDNRIRWFTPAATRVIRLNETDAGRSLSDLSHDFDRDDLTVVTRQVLKTLVPVEDEVTCPHERTYLRRVLPYRTEDDRIAGVIITFVDISERKRAEIALAESERRLRELAKSLEQQVEHRISALKVLHDITMAANEARSVDAAIKAALERICQFNGWVLGHAWRTMDGEVVSAKVWQVSRHDSRHGSQFDSLRKAKEQLRLPLGDEFIGEVVRTGNPIWIPNLEDHPGRLRDYPKRYGLRSAIAFPVSMKGKVIAALEFFSDKEITRDDRFMEIMPQVGIQLGHVYERKRLEREVAMVTDSEQQRMGQELHDGLSQQIAGIGMLAGSLADNLKTGGDSQVADKAARLVSAIEDAKQQSRALSKGLMPIEIDSHGLCPALEELADRTQKTYDIQCTVECSRPAAALDNFTATHLYRIASEAIHNAVKHASAKRMWIQLTDGSQVTLSVRDDGVGIRSGRAAEGEGLRIMRHRAGLIGATISLLAAEGGGTIVTCTVVR